MKYQSIVYAFGICLLGCGSDDANGNANDVDRASQIRDASMSQPSSTPIENDPTQTLGGQTATPSNTNPAGGRVSPETSGERADLGGVPRAGSPETGGRINAAPGMGGQSVGPVGGATAGMPATGGAPSALAGQPSNGGQAMEPAQGDDIFPRAAGVLTQLEMNGTVLDTSGNDNHATLIGVMNGRFVNTPFGQGITVTGGTDGFNWRYIGNGGLQAPFTIEIVITVQQTDGMWGKIVGHDATDWTGIWFETVRNRLELWPNSAQIEDHLDTAGQNIIGSRLYLALRSSADNQIELLVNGAVTDSSNLSDGLNLPNPLLVFFQDRFPGGNNNNVTGVIDAIRISQVLRTNDEIAAVNAHLNTRQPQ